MSRHAFWTGVAHRLGLGGRREPAATDSVRPAAEPESVGVVRPRAGTVIFRAVDRSVTASYRPSMVLEAEAMLAGEPTAIEDWWRMVVFRVADVQGPVTLSPT